jgi:hypothetical protein
LQKPSNKSRAGYTPPRSNASCLSQRSHARLRDTRWRSHRQACRRRLLHASRQQGHPAAPRQEPRQRSYKSQC